MPIFPLLDMIDAIYVINLDFRTDRRAEMERQLASLGLSYAHPKVTLFPAKRPSSPQGFPNVGSRGCFLSHLGILKDAIEKNYGCILILEDDADFKSDFYGIKKSDIDLIKQTPWDIFNFGSTYNAANHDDIFIPIPISEPLKQSHSIMLKKSAILTLAPYLETILTRKQGDPRGGPMHIDGAYNWFRKDNPDIKTIVPKMPWAIQRSSKTDIHDTGWKEHIPFIGYARKVKNRLFSR